MKYSLLSPTNLMLLQEMLPVYRYILNIVYCVASIELFMRWMPVSSEQLRKSTKFQNSPNGFSNFSRIFEFCILCPDLRENRLGKVMNYMRKIRLSEYEQNSFIQIWAKFVYPGLMRTILHNLVPRSPNIGWQVALFIFIFRIQIMHLERA